MGDTPQADPAREFVDFMRHRLLPAVAEAFGRPTPTPFISIIPDALMPESLGAEYSEVLFSTPVIERLYGEPPICRSINIRLTTAVEIASFLRGGSLLLEPEERARVLGYFRAQLSVLVHEAIHSLWPNSASTVRQHEAELSVPGTRALYEGFTEAATREHLDDILLHCGAASVDANLLTCEAIDYEIYPGILEATQTLVDGVSRMAGGTAAEQYRLIVADRCGAEALSGLVARGLGETATPTAISRACADIHHDWSELWQAMAKFHVVSEEPRPLLNERRDTGRLAATRQLTAMQRLPQRSPAGLSL